MPALSETLPALEQRLTECLLAFERLDEAWRRGRTAIERAEIGRQREDALSEIVTFASASSPLEPGPWPTPRCSSGAWWSWRRKRPGRTPCCPRPTCTGWSPQCWRWSSGKRAMKRLESVTFCNLLDARKPRRAAAACRAISGCSSPPRASRPQHLTTFWVSENATHSPLCSRLNTRRAWAHSGQFA